MTTLPALNVSQLAREHNVSRTTIRRRLASGWQPAQAPTSNHLVDITEMVPPSTASTPWTATVLVCVAFGIGALALLVNAQAGFYLGSTPLARATFAALAVAADILAILLPTVALTLWTLDRPVLSATAWAVFAAVGCLAVLATIGFAERNLGDSAAAREGVVVSSTAAITNHQAAIEAAKVAATTATRQREAECARRGPICREREADERTALSDLRAALAAPLPIVSRIGVADPQAAGAQRLATWAGLRVTGDDVVNLRLALLTLVPNLAGLVLAFGVALRRSEA